MNRATGWTNLNPINSSLIATAIVPIAAAVGVSVGRSAVLTSALYLATAIARPTAGKLAEVFGASRILLTGIGAAVLGGLVGGVGMSLARLRDHPRHDGNCESDGALHPRCGSADRNGVGLLRSCGYIGSIASSAVAALVFRAAVDDRGLH